MVFHYLVRGIIVNEGRVLLVRKRGSRTTFLPGGHIEIGERAEAALVREIEEELGKKGVVRRFVGAVEHTWIENGQENHEINLVFDVEVAGLDSGSAPESLESHLEFLWSIPQDLKDHNLEPYPLIECLTDMGRRFEGFWGSSLE